MFECAAVGAGLVIFDCDGVLVDSDRISLRIQAERIAALGLPVTYEDTVREFLGIGMPATLRRIEEWLGRPLPDDWEAELEAAVEEAFRRELEPVPGIVEALDRISLPTCIASSASHEKMMLTLGLTGLYERFAGRIFSADEVERGKPDPDLFFYAAERMEVVPERCIVVEDSPWGVAAGIAAGMSVLGYSPATERSTVAGLFDAGAIVFTDMAELPRLLAAAS
jgi:HAD superfamily hydrolase (TIGR01509 family)